MMHMHSESSETSFILLINRNRLKMCCKLYWRVVVIFLTPLILVPVACISDKNAYKCFYVFLITVVYWLTDVLHPSIVALLPIAASSVMNTFEHGFLSAFYMTTELLDSVAIMMIIIGIEYSRVHRRIAVKLLLIIGCSHYRLSFLLFFTTMFASMWISSVLACGVMMPLVKAILVELEKMGILEMYTSVGKSTQRSTRHELNTPRPTPFTIFYFLGIAYSSSIGGITKIMGSQTNQVFKGYCETIFPDSPKIEFPHFMLLNLPGVLVMETAMYFWLNFYFLGMFRAESDIALEVGLTDEEAQYINTLLASQYAQLGRVKFHEIIVGVLVILACILQSTVSVAYFENQGRVNFHSHYKVSSPSFLSVFLLCIAPVDLKVLKFFKRQNNGNRAMPQYPSKACLNWELVRSNLHWSVLFIVGGSSALFESLKDSHMTEEMEKFLLIFKSWPAPALAIVVIVFCQILTQFAPNSCVAYCLLPSIARLSINSDVNPHYLMVAATLASSMSFHLVTGSPANAMVCAYTHIPPWKMVSVGIGPSLSAIVIVWFTVVVWSTVVWTDINQDPSWADTNILKNF